MLPINVGLKMTPEEVAAVGKFGFLGNHRKTADGDLGGVALESEPEPGQPGSREHVDAMIVRSQSNIGHHSESFSSSSHVSWGSYWV